jgi:hypothetical protein
MRGPGQRVALRGQGAAGSELMAGSGWALQAESGHGV